MKLIKMLASFALLLLVSFTARGQQPIIGGNLISAQPGPVLVQLLAANVPAPLTWEMPIRWYVAGSVTETRSTGGDIGSPLVPFGSFGSFPGQQSVGNTISTPSLPASTFVVLAARIVTPGTPQALFNDERTLYSHTGTLARPFFSTPSGAVPAAVFAGPNNTVRVGFTFDEGFFSNPAFSFSPRFLDYPIRVVVSNVCVK